MNLSDQVGNPIVHFWCSSKQISSMFKIQIGSLWESIAAVMKLISLSFPMKCSSCLQNKIRVRSKANQRIRTNLKVRSH